MNPTSTLSNEDQLHSLLEQVTINAQLLATSRPTAVNLFWALDRLKNKAAMLIEHPDDDHTRSSQTTAS